MARLIDAEPTVLEVSGDQPWTARLHSAPSAGNP